MRGICSQGCNDLGEIPQAIESVMGITNIPVLVHASVARHISSPLTTGITKCTRLFCKNREGPWYWFIFDFAIAFIAASVAFSLTPYSNDILRESVIGEHVGRLGFCFGAGLLVALVAHILGLHETYQGRASLKFLGRCAAVCGISLILLNIELLLVHYLIVGRLITFYAFLISTIGLFAFRALVVGLVVRNECVVGFVGSQKFTDKVHELDNLQSELGIKTIGLTLTEKKSKKILNWARKNRVSQIVVDPTDPISPTQAELLALMNVSLDVSSYSNFVEKMHQRIPSEHINAQWVIECQNEHAVLSVWTFVHHV